MTYDNEFIYESYVNHRKKFILESNISEYYRQNPLEQIYDLYKYDIDCIEELVEEGAFGDMWGKVKGGVGQATKFVANKGIEMLLGLLKKTLTPEDLKGIEQLQDPAKLKEYAAKGMKELNAAGSSQAQPTTNNESAVYSNKRLFAAAILSENNLLEMFEKYTFITEQILTEAKKQKVYETEFDRKKREAAEAAAKEEAKKAKAAAKAAAKSANKQPAKQSIASSTPAPAAPTPSAAPSSAAPAVDVNKLTAAARSVTGQLQPRGAGALNKYVKQVANELRKRYSKSPSQLQDGLRSFNQQLTAELGKKTTANASGSPAKGPIGSLPKTPTAGGAATSAGTTTTAAGTTAAGGAPATNVSVPSTPQKEGLIRKAINWVKSNPKRTAGTVLGILAVLAVAVGGWAVLAPMLAKYGLLAGAAKGAILGGAKSAVQNIAQQGFSDKKFSGSELAKKTAKGAGWGTVMGGLLGLGGGDDGGGDDGGDGGDGDNDEDYVKDDTRRGELQYKRATGFQEPEPDEMEPDDEPPVDDDEFAKYNVPREGSPEEQAASGFDQTSPMDQAKKMIMQKLKALNNGEIPASKYNAAAAKVAGLLKKGLKPDQIASQLVTDSVSYTKGYLEYF
jgi:hypothetical protein